MSYDLPIELVPTDLKHSLEDIRGGNLTHCLATGDSSYALKGCISFWFRKEREEKGGKSSTNKRGKKSEQKGGNPVSSVL